MSIKNRWNEILVVHWYYPFGGADIQLLAEIIPYSLIGNANKVKRTAKGTINV